LPRKIAARLRYTQVIAEQQLCARELPVAIPWIYSKAAASL
jgi:hypothetical protein